MSVLRDRGLRKLQHQHHPSRTSMDDWYLDVCKRNMNKLSVIDNEQPVGGRPRSGSFKYTVTFVKGDTNSGSSETLAGPGSVKRSGSSQSLRQHFSDPSDTYSSTAIDTKLLFPQSYSDAMRRMHTDPRILTGQKGAPTLTHWYDSEITGVSPDHQLSGSSSEVNSPESVQNQSQLNASEVVDGHHVSPEQVICDRLLAKINRTNEQLISEQNAKQLSVNEYLQLTSGASPMDRAQAQRVKAAFERRNQKSTAVVAQLQRKLESYKQRLNEIESSRRMSTGSGTMATTTGSPWPAFDLLKGIRDLRSGISGFSGTIVTKPRVLAHMIRNKFGSADNISSMRDMDDSEPLQEANSAAHVRIGSTLPASFRRYSDEDMSRLGMTSASSVALSPSHTPVSLRGTVSRQQNSSDVDVTSFLECLKNNRQVLQSQMDKVLELKTHLAANQKKWKEEIELERARGENLYDRLNDLSDVHQDELLTVKQELSTFEEKLAYQLDERMRDMHEMVDNCHNRLAKLEAVQQRTTVEGIDNSNVRLYIVKLINVALSFLALLLIVVSFVVDLLRPVFSSRSHLLVASACVAVAVAVWLSWDTLTAFVSVQQQSSL